MNEKLQKVLLKSIFIFLFKSYSIKIYANTVNYKTINNHLIQLEHISKAHSQCLTQFQKQLLEIEQEIDSLRGQIQKNEHILLKIIEKQNCIVKKIDSIVKKHLNTIENDVIPFPKNNINNDCTSSSITNVNSNCHVTVYNKAVKLVLEKKQYEHAIQLFQEFILQYPHSPYQANAHYWLGQLNYRQGNKNEASYHFALVAKNYPKSSKAADSLLKVGIIMEENGYKEKAKSVYKKICHLYPNTDTAKQSLKRQATINDK